MQDFRETPPPYEPTWAELRRPACDQAWARLAKSAHALCSPTECRAVDLLDLAKHVDLLTRAFGWDA